VRAFIGVILMVIVIAIVMVIVLVVGGGLARADDGFSLSLRGGGFVRDDRGYGDHAAAFGFGDPQLGGGGVVEAGVRVGPRLWVLTSWTGFSSLGARGESELQVRQQTLLAQLAFTVYRRAFAFELEDEGEEAIALDLAAVTGGGVTFLSDDLDGAGSSERGAIGRSGAQLRVSWRAVGLDLAYGWHYSRVSVRDRLGGELGAGGHEISAGLSLAW
ncbi:MAG TPA: hypothetical protein VMZ28_29710, partial [Kofleriaceae bacterium]|nr:hypothetical protein [Kofleriaceae bacterium]